MNIATIINTMDVEEITISADINGEVFPPEIFDIIMSMTDNCSRLMASMTCQAAARWRSGRKTTMQILLDAANGGHLEIYTMLSGKLRPDMKMNDHVKYPYPPNAVARLSTDIVCKWLDAGITLTGDAYRVAYAHRNYQVIKLLVDRGVAYSDRFADEMISKPDFKALSMLDAHRFAPVVLRFPPEIYWSGYSYRFHTVADTLKEAYRIGADEFIHIIQNRPINIVMCLYGTRPDLFTADFPFLWAVILTNNRDLYKWAVDSSIIREDEAYRMAHRTGIVAIARMAAEMGIKPIDGEVYSAGQDRVAEYIRWVF